MIVTHNQRDQRHGHALLCFMTGVASRWHISHFTCLPTSFLPLTYRLLSSLDYNISAAQHVYDSQQQYRDWLIVAPRLREYSAWLLLGKTGPLFSPPLHCVLLTRIRNEFGNPFNTSAYVPHYEHVRQVELISRELCKLYDSGICLCNTSATSS